MAGFHLAAVPIGRLSVEELEAALSRAAKVLRQPIELREPLPVPRGTEDSERGQHRAAAVMTLLGQEVLKLKPGRLIGSSDPEARTPYQPDGFLFFTDIDLFTAKSEGVFAALMTSRHWSVVSIRRLREAFYKRRADPLRQRARVVKEVLRMSARLAGLSECQDPSCAVAPSKNVLDIDTKEERFCRVCEQKFFEGLMHI